jgi:hypothetical protein
VRKPRGIPSFAPNCSPGSQFSREYRRLFGAPPGQDGERLRRSNELRGAAYLSQSLGFHHAEFREVAASVRPSGAFTMAIQGVPTVR